MRRISTATYLQAMTFLLLGGALLILMNLPGSMATEDLKLNWRPSNPTEAARHNTVTDQANSDLQTQELLRAMAAQH